MKVCVIGTGYVGLVTGVCLSEIGNEVVCVDKVKEKIELLKKGKSPIYEPDLELFLERNINNKRLVFTTDIASAITGAEIIYICVGTPPLSNGQANLNYVEEVANEIGKYINNGKIIINKSTVPIGSGDWLSMIVSDSIEKDNEIKDIDFDVVSNPEFLREGSAIGDTFFPDRIVIGSSSEKAIEKMVRLYDPLINQSFDWPENIDRRLAKGTKVPVVISDLTSAEMIKYAANSFLATKISFINEVANICEKVGADITKVSQGMGLDSRISSKFLNAGIGWGGSCFPKDVSALSYIAGEYGLTTQILNSVIGVNRDQRLKVIQRVQEELKIIKGKTIGVLGISFKPDTDDTRDAPGIIIMNDLAGRGARIKAYDPIVKERPDNLSEKVKVFDNANDVMKDTDILIIATEWEEFKNIDFLKAKSLVKTPLIIDGRNCLDKDTLESYGYKYFGIGR